MANRKQPRKTWFFFIGGLGLAGITLGIILFVDAGLSLWTVIRFGSLMGYVMVFVACLSSAFLRQLTRTFGRSFIQVHHIVSVSGLVLLLAHALAVAWSVKRLIVFFPFFSSLTRFLEFGGQPAIWLMGAASLAAVLRSRLRKSWRTVHWLNYIAFLLGTVHALLIGSDFTLLPVRVVSIAMAGVVIGVFVWKRVAAARRRAARRR
jgi:predicted ferric reductase